MKILLPLTFFSLLSIANLISQPYASYFLQSNNVRTNFTNQAIVNFNDRLNAENANWLAPNNPYLKTSMIYTSQIILCGENANQKLGCSSYLYNYDYLPGPYFSLKDVPNTKEIAEFNKVWATNKTDILAHKTDFSTDKKIDKKLTSIYSWPGRGNPHFESYNQFKIKVANYPLAPFHDEDQGGIYDPDQGDYPWIDPINKDVPPDQLLWTMFHSDAPNLIAEFGITSYVYYCPENDFLHNTVFHSISVSHKDEAFGNLTKAYLGVFTDNDLGCYADDYIGCLPQKNMSFWYNMDALDGDSIGNCINNIVSYKKNIPAGSLLFLNRKLDALTPFFNQGIANFPDLITPNKNSFEYFNVMQGLTRNGKQVINPTTNQPSSHWFSGNPNDKNEWSMRTENLPEIDSRFLSSNSINTLELNKTVRLDFAYSFHHHKDSNHIQNVNLAIQNCDKIQSIYDNKFSLVCNENKCQSDCVWPSDTDNNGRVEYLDAIPIFKGMNLTGDTRKDPFIWRGQSLADWQTKIPNGLNAKYADANGDGIINNSDLEMLNFYMHSEHDNPITKTYDCNDGDDIILSLDSAFLTRSIKRIKIRFKDPSEKILGFSFEMHIDSSIVRSYSAPFFKWSDTLVKNLQFDYTDGSFGISRNQHVMLNDKSTNENFQNNLFFSLASKANNANPPLEAEVQICNGRFYFADGTSRPLHSNKIKVKFTTIVNQDDFDISNVTIYPNPATDRLYIQGINGKYSATLLSIEGKAVRKYNQTSSQEHFSLEGIGAGIYFLNIEHGGRKIVKKLIIER
ncbi:MAG: T9SS type A sorting domain-containing protein [Saprospiraceae bacterium]|nr:T9SS type A sorting domain-containing protein [Saprospiraceae bacterium]